MIKKFLYSVLFLCVGLVNAQDTTLFDKATQQYADNNFKAAIQSYQSILNQGKTSAELYYNLANAHYKLGDIAPSIYYYNKALQLSPNDEDIKTNLALAKERKIDLIEPAPQTGLQNFVNGLISTYNFETWALWAIVGGFICLIFGVLYYFTPQTGKKRAWFSLSVLGLVCAALCLTFAFQQFSIQKTHKYAIVFNKEETVHAEPNPNASQVFVLHEGTKVKILDSFQGFAQIELADNKQGWISLQAIKKL